MAKELKKPTVINGYTEKYYKQLDQEKRIQACGYYTRWMAGNRERPNCNICEQNCALKEGHEKDSYNPMIPILRSKPYKGE